MGMEKMRKRFCPGCKRWFEKKAYNQDYCSIECREVFTRPLISYKQRVARRKRRESKGHTYSQQIKQLPHNPFMGNVGLNCNSKWVQEYGQGLVLGF